MKDIVIYIHSHLKQKKAIKYPPKKKEKRKKKGKEQACERMIGRWNKEVWTWMILLDRLQVLY